MIKMSNELKEKINKDIDITKNLDGKNLKELISATRKIAREFKAKKEAIENETGFKIDDSSRSRITIEMNTESEIVYDDYGMDIGFDYDDYSFDADGNIECICSKNSPIKPQANTKDIDKINQYKDKLIELAKEHEKISEQTRVDLPGTDLSALISGCKISLVHNLKSDSEGIFLLDDGADFWLLAEGKYDTIGIPRGKGFIEDISSFLEDVHVPEEKIPEYIKENIQEKISVFPLKSKYSFLGENYKITDYSPIKEKLAEIVKRVKDKKKTKEKGDIENEQEFTND